MRSLIRFHATRHDCLITEGGSPFKQWSRQKAWRQNTQVRLELSQELREALLVHSVCCVRFWPKLLGISVVVFCSGALTMPMVVTAALAFSSGHFCPFFSLACRRGKPLELELYLVQLGCLPRELSGHHHEIFFHATKLKRGMNSRLRYHDKMVD